MPRIGYRGRNEGGGRRHKFRLRARPETRRTSILTVPTHQAADFTSTPDAPPTRHRSIEKPSATTELNPTWVKKDQLGRQRLTEADRSHGYHEGPREARQGHSRYVRDARTLIIRLLTLFNSPRPHRYVQLLRSRVEKRRKEATKDTF